MRKLIISVFFSLLIFSSAFAQERSFNNLSELDVLIENLPAALNETNLTKRQLKADIELKLRQNGLKVSDDVYQAYVYLNINSLPIRYKNGEVLRYVYNVSLELKQVVYLSRDIEIIVSGATTWSSGGIGYATPAQIEDNIRDYVDDLLNRFLNEYLKVNPE